MFIIVTHDTTDKASLMFNRWDTDFIKFIPNFVKAFYLESPARDTIRQTLDFICNVDGTVRSPDNTVICAGREINSPYDSDGNFIPMAFKA